MNATLHAQIREETTARGLRELRERGMIPGVIYGKKLGAAAAIAVEAKELLALMRTHPNSIVDVEVPGAGKTPAVVSDVQRDALSRQVLHVDFRQIDLNQHIRMPVRLELIGESPAEKEGGMVQMIQHEIEVECLPADLPESIQVPVDGLQTGDRLTAGELTLPAGVKLLHDADMVVVAALAPQKGRSEEEREALDDAAEEDEAHRKAAVAVEKD